MKPIPPNGYATVAEWQYGESTGKAPSIHYHMLDCLGRMEDTGNVIYQEKMNKKLLAVHRTRFIEDHSYEEWKKLPQLFAD